MYLKAILFKSHNLTDIFSRLDDELKKTDRYDLREEFEQIRSTYLSMIGYIIQGIDDPDSKDIYQDLIRRCYKVYYRLMRHNRLTTSLSDQYTQIHNQQRSSASLSSLLSDLQTIHPSPSQSFNLPHAEDETPFSAHATHLLNHQMKLNDVFNYLWTSDMLSSMDIDSLRSFFSSPSASRYDKSVIISSLYLGLTEMFDEGKFLFITSTYINTNGESELQMRCLVILVLLCRKYDKLLKYFPSTQSVLSTLLEDSIFVERTFLVLMQLQFTRLTDSVSNLMMNDILPTLMKEGKFQSGSIEIEDIDNYLTQNGENPEWHRGSIDSVAHEKMEEMASLQMEGADVHYGSFRHAKNGPFFQTLSNWFAPFSFTHPLVYNQMLKYKSNSTAVTFMKKFLMVSPFCSSDKYSFLFLTMSQLFLGNNQLGSAMSHALSEEMDESPDGQNERYNIHLKDSTISRQYIEDLYRFFTVYSKHTEFANPFSSELPSFSPLSSGVFSPLQKSYNEVLSLGEFFMRKGFYSDAISLFNVLSPQEREIDSSIWQKIGFCEQKLGNYPSALEHYLRAFNLDSSSTWTLKHLARVSFTECNYSDAEHYYDMLLSAFPDNTDYLRNKSICQIKTSNYSSALPILYKLYYLDENDKDVICDLGKCHLLCGESSKALPFYQLLSSQSPEDPTSYIQLGTLYYIDGDRPNSYKYFCEAYSKLSSDSQRRLKFKRLFVDSARLVKECGKDVLSFEMIYDGVVLGLINPSVL